MAFGQVGEKNEDKDCNFITALGLMTKKVLSPTKMYDKTSFILSCNQMSRSVISFLYNKKYFIKLTCTKLNKILDGFKEFIITRFNVIKTLH